MEVWEGSGRRVDVTGLLNHEFSSPVGGEVTEEDELAR